MLIKKICFEISTEKFTAKFAGDAAFLKLNLEIF